MTDIFLLVPVYIIRVDAEVHNPITSLISNLPLAGTHHSQDLLLVLEHSDKNTHLIRLCLN